MPEIQLKTELIVTKKELCEQLGLKIKNVQWIGYQENKLYVQFKKHTRTY